MSWASGPAALLGLIDTVPKLWQTGTYSASFSYLNVLSLSFKIDALAAFFLVAIFAVCLLAAIYSFHYMDKPREALRTAANYLFFSLLTVSMALVVVADNMITFMLCWEIMSLSSFFLVIYNYEVPANRKAGYLYFVFSQVGALFILAAFALIYSHGGGFGFAAAADLPHSLKMMVFILAFIGFGSKAGVFPFHVWLPHAHPAAPSHISAVMSGVMIKTGIYGILRMYDILNWHTPVFGYIVLVAGMVSGILGVVYALGQHDIKRLLAYHSVENIGIILIGIGIGMIGVAADQPFMAVLGFAGGLLHVLNHAIFKSLLFMGAGMVLHKTGTGTIDLLGGLIKRMKITGTTFLIGSLAISGLPPFNGFVSEFLIYMGGFRGRGPGPRRLCGRSAWPSSAWRSLAVWRWPVLPRWWGWSFRANRAASRPKTSMKRVRSCSFPWWFWPVPASSSASFPGTFMIMAVKGVSALKLGYGTASPGTICFPCRRILHGWRRSFWQLSWSYWHLRIFLYRGKKVGRSGTWGCGFTQPTVKMQYTGSSYAASILEFFRPVAPLKETHPAIKGRFPVKTHYHSHIHDAAELQMDRLIVRPVLWLFDRLRWLQHGDIHLYIGYILLAIVLLLFFV